MGVSIVEISYAKLIKININNTADYKFYLLLNSHTCIFRQNFYYREGNILDMSFRLICGKSGSGKSNFCFDEIVEKLDKNNKIYIITPEQFSYTAEKKLLEKINTGAIMVAEVLTFDRMAYRVANEVYGSTKTNISASGKAMLVYNILLNKKKELKFLGKSDKNIDMVLTQITELKKHNISIEKLKEIIESTEDKYLKAKLEDIYAIYESFEQNIENKYIDENDKLDILAQQLEKTDMFKNTIIYIDEFAGFTPQEYNIIKALARKAKQISVTVCTDDLDMQTNPDTDIFYSNKKTASKLLYMAKTENIELEKTVFLKNQYRFKSLELEHLEKNIYEVTAEPYQKEVQNVSLFLASNNYSEVENVAKQAVKLVRDEGYRFRDIAVITKELETYSNLCKAIFSKYDIPVFIDEKKELSKNILVKYIISILDIFTKNWSYESMFNYIKSGILNIDKDDIFLLENYCIKWGIKGKKWQNEWNFKEEKELQEKLENIRKQIVEPLINLKQNLSGTKTVEQITKELYKFLVDNNIEQILQNKKNEMIEKDVEIANEYEIAWKVIIDLFDELILIFGQDKTTFEKYIEILKTGLGNSGLGKIPAAQDQVTVGDVDRTRSHKVKAIFIIGLNDGIFPSIHKDEGFLNDNDRKNLKEKGIELAKGTLEQLYEDNFAIYKAFTTAEEKLYLSYSSASLDGATLRPSMLIKKIKNIFPKLKEESDIIYTNSEIITEKSTLEELINNLREFRDGENIDLKWIDVYNYYITNEEYKDKLEMALKAINYENVPEVISQENIDKLYGKKLNTSVSRLEKYRACPFSYHLTYGLKLSEKNNFKVEAIDTGTFMHETIDEFFNRTRENGINIKEISEEQIEKIIEQIVNEKLNLDKNYIFTSTDKYKLLAMRLKKVITKSMKYILETLKNSDFEVFGNELEFKEGKTYKPIKLELENGRMVEITGKIDRVDIAQMPEETKSDNYNQAENSKSEIGDNNKKYIRIIDYKSSIKDIDLDQVVAGLQLQLLTYLDATCKIEDVLPAGVLYFNLIDPIIKSEKQLTDEEIEEKLKKQFKMKGLILADVKVIKMMDKKLEAGYSTMVPAYISKDGKISEKRSKVLTKEQFEHLQDYTRKLLKQISEEILSGSIKIEPYYNTKNKTTPCKYCNYKSICHY